MVILFSNNPFMANKLEFVSRQSREMSQKSKRGSPVRPALVSVNSRRPGSALYSAADEEEVHGAHDGLDRCAALLDQLMRASNRGNGQHTCVSSQKGQPPCRSLPLNNSSRVGPTPSVKPGRVRSKSLNRASRSSHMGDQISRHEGPILRRAPQRSSTPAVPPKSHHGPSVSSIAKPHPTDSDLKKRSRHKSAPEGIEWRKTDATSLSDTDLSRGRDHRIVDGNRDGSPILSGPVGSSTQPTLSASPAEAEHVLPSTAKLHEVVQGLLDRAIASGDDELQQLVHTLLLQTHALSVLSMRNGLAVTEVSCPRGMSVPAKGTLDTLKEENKVLRRKLQEATRKGQTAKSRLKAIEPRIAELSSLRDQLFVAKADLAKEREKNATLQEELRMESKEKKKALQLAHDQMNHFLQQQPPARGALISPDYYFPAYTQSLSKANVSPTVNTTTASLLSSSAGSGRTSPVASAFYQPAFAPVGLDLDITNVTVPISVMVSSSSTALLSTSGSKLSSVSRTVQPTVSSSSFALGNVPASYSKPGLQHTTRREHPATVIGASLSKQIYDQDSSFFQLPGETTTLNQTAEVVDSQATTHTLSAATSSAVLLGHHLGAGKTSMTMTTSSSLESISVSSLPENLNESSATFGRCQRMAAGLQLSSGVNASLLAVLPGQFSTSKPVVVSPQTTSPSSGSTRLTWASPSDYPSTAAKMAIPSSTAYTTDSLHLNGIAGKFILPSSVRHSAAALASTLEDLDLESSTASLPSAAAAGTNYSLKAVEPTDAVSASDATTINEEDFQRGMAALDAGIARLRAQLSLSSTDQRKPGFSTV